ncbi:MAG: potassium-transporting ATPase subunit KdpA [Thermoplasmata archaeon]
MFPLESLVDVALLIALVLAIAPWFGAYLGRVYLNRPAFGDSILTPIESWIYRLLGTSPRQTMRFKEYAAALLLTSGVLFVWMYLVLTLQGGLPGNVLGIPNMSWDLAYHTTASFLTNTDFQHYNPQTSMSLWGSLLSLQVAMFLSAGCGLAVVAAFIRGFTRKDGTLGNFYVDLVRTMTRVLLPLALLASVLLVLLGLPQTFTAYVTAHTLGGGTQTLYLGPVASWQAIDLLGTNGGGWYAANAAMPYANPSAASNLLETGLMLLIPLSTPFAFAEIVRRPGEGLPFVGTILIVLLVGIGLFLFFQGGPNPSLLGVHGLTQNALGYPTFGTESRWSISESSAFQVVSVYTNTGANNLAIGSLNPLAQGVLLFGMFTQSTPGGDGTGFGMLLVFAVIAVFVGGLMVGRTPEYLGKKVGKEQMRWSAGLLLLHPALVLVPLAFAILGGFVVFGGGIASHAYLFTSVLYEFTSESANNGSSLGSLADNTLFFNLVGGTVMLIGRFYPMIGMLAIGSIFAEQEVLPPGPGTLRTRSATFTIYLTLLLIIISALLFLPVPALGPFAQLGF